MEIFRKRYQAQMSKDTRIAVYDGLKRNYSPFLSHFQQRFRTSLGLSAQVDAARLKGEIYRYAENQFLYYYIPPGKTLLEVGGVFADRRPEGVFNEFCDKVERILAPFSNGALELVDVDMPNFQFCLVQEETEILSVENGDFDAAASLKDKEIRDLLRRIKSRESCLLSTLVEDESQLMRFAPAVDVIEKNGLISKEYLVFCRETGNQISRVGSIQAIQEATSRGFKCFSCGRNLSEEKMDQLLKCTAKGAKFAKPNYWLAVLLLKALADTGIQPSTVFSHSEKGFEIFDLFFKDNGLMIMVEVKDDLPKLNELYTFISRVEYYQPDLAILFSVNEISREARSFLEQYTKIPLRVIHNMENLEKDIKQIVLEKKREYLKEVLKGFNHLTEQDVYSLALERLHGEGDYEAASVEVEQETRGISDFEKALMEDIGETGEIGVELLEPVFEGETAEPAMEDIPGAMEEMIAAEAESIPIEEPFLEPYVEAADLEAALLEEERGEAMIQEMDTGFLPLEEISPTEVILEDAEEVVARKILEQFKDGPLFGRLDAIETGLKEINQANYIYSAVSNDEGLVVINALPVSTDADVFCAYALATLQNTRGALVESGFEDPYGMILLGSASHIRLYPGSGASLFVYEDRKGLEMIESVEEIPEEDISRSDAIKKLLEEIGSVEAFEANAVIKRDGTVISEYPSSYANKRALVDVPARVIMENEPYFERLRFEQMQQVLVKTPRNTISCIILDDDKFLVSILESGVSKELWNIRLMGIANRLKRLFH